MTIIRRDTSEIEDHIHDNVYAQSLQTKGHIVDILSEGLGIERNALQEDKVIIDILEQLSREENNLLSALGEYTEASGRETNLLATNINYDRIKAKIYMDTYWKNYNKAYPSFDTGGGDCANFISQVLFAGGMEWINDGIPSHYTWYTNWYCKPGATNKDGDNRITLTWKLAEAFKNHWSKRAAKTYMKSFTEAIEGINDIVNDVYIGDVVQFCYSNATPWHTLGVTGYTVDKESGKNDIVLASHTRDSNSRSLLRTMYKYPGDYKLRVYIIKESE